MMEFLSKCKLFFSLRMNSYNKNKHGGQAELVSSSYAACCDAHYIFDNMSIYSIMQNHKKLQPLFCLENLPGGG